MILTVPHRTLRPVITLLAVLAVTMLLAPVQALARASKKFVPAR